MGWLLLIHGKQRKVLFQVDRASTFALLPECKSCASGDALQAWPRTQPVRALDFDALRHDGPFGGFKRFRFVVKALVSLETFWRFRTLLNRILSFVCDDGVEVHLAVGAFLRYDVNTLVLLRSLCGGAPCKNQTKRCARLFSCLSLGACSSGSLSDTKTTLLAVRGNISSIRNSGISAGSRRN